MSHAHMVYGLWLDNEHSPKPCWQEQDCKYVVLMTFDFALQSHGNHVHNFNNAPTML